MMDDNSEGLAGRLLLAIPTMSDPFFSQTATLLCQQDEKGAMGLVVNQPTKLTMDEVFDSLQIEALDHVSARAVHYGGPVQPETGFLLHDSPLPDVPAEWEILPGLHLSTSREAMHALAQSDESLRWIFCLGYAGWSAGQLEQEIAGDSWIVCETDREGILGVPPNQIIRNAATQAGLNLARLASLSGHA